VTRWRRGQLARGNYAEFVRRFLQNDRILLGCSRIRREVEDFLRSSVLLDFVAILGEPAQTRAGGPGPIFTATFFPEEFFCFGYSRSHASSAVFLARFFVPLQASFLQAERPERWSYSNAGNSKNSHADVYNSCKFIPRHPPREFATGFLAQLFRSFIKPATLLLLSLSLSLSLAAVFLCVRVRSHAVPRFFPRNGGLSLVSRFKDAWRTIGVRRDPNLTVANYYRNH